MEMKSRDNIFMPSGDRYKNTIAFIVPFHNMLSFCKDDRVLEMKKFNRPHEGVVMLAGDLCWFCTFFNAYEAHLSYLPTLNERIEKMMSEIDICYINENGEILYVIPYIVTQLPNFFPENDELHLAYATICRSKKGINLFFKAIETSYFNTSYIYTFWGRVSHFVLFFIHSTFLPNSSSFIFDLLSKNNIQHCVDEHNIFITRSHFAMIRNNSSYFDGKYSTNDINQYYKGMGTNSYGIDFSSPRTLEFIPVSSKKRASSNSSSAILNQKKQKIAEKESTNAALKKFIIVSNDVYSSSEKMKELNFTYDNIRRKNEEMLIEVDEKMKDEIAKADKKLMLLDVEFAELEKLIIEKKKAYDEFVKKVEEDFKRLEKEQEESLRKSAEQLLEMEKEMSDKIEQSRKLLEEVKALGIPSAIEKAQKELSDLISQQIELSKRLRNDKNESAAQFEKEMKDIKEKFESMKASLQKDIQDDIFRINDISSSKTQLALAKEIIKEDMKEMFIDAENEIDRKQLSDMIENEEASARAAESKKEHFDREESRHDDYLLAFAEYRMIHVAPNERQENALREIYDEIMSIEEARHELNLIAVENEKYDEIHEATFARDVENYIDMIQAELLHDVVEEESNALTKEIQSIKSSLKQPKVIPPKEKTELEKLQDEIMKKTAAFRDRTPDNEKEEDMEIEGIEKETAIEKLVEVKKVALKKENYEMKGAVPDKSSLSSALNKMIKGDDSENEESSYGDGDDWDTDKNNKKIEEKEKKIKILEDLKEKVVEKNSEVMVSKEESRHAAYVEMIGRLKNPKHKLPFIVSENISYIEEEEEKRHSSNLELIKNNVDKLHHNNYFSSPQGKVMVDELTKNYNAYKSKLRQDYVEFYSKYNIVYHNNLKFKFFAERVKKEVDSIENDNIFKWNKAHFDLNFTTFEDILKDIIVNESMSVSQTNNYLEDFDNHLYELARSRVDEYVDQHLDKKFIYFREHYKKALLDYLEKIHQHNMNRKDDNLKLYDFPTVNVNLYLQDMLMMFTQFRDDYIIEFQKEWKVNEKKLGHKVDKNLLKSFKKIFVSYFTSKKTIQKIYSETRKKKNSDYDDHEILSYIVSNPNFKGTSMSWGYKGTIIFHDNFKKPNTEKSVPLKKYVGKYITNDFNIITPFEIYETFDKEWYETIQQNTNTVNGDLVITKEIEDNIIRPAMKTLAEKTRKRLEKSKKK